MQDKYSEGLSINAALRPTPSYNYKTNTLFLSVHLLFAFFYRAMNTPILFWYNLFSIMIFLAGYAILPHGKKRFYVIMTYSEIALFTILNVVCLGWEFGFQTYLFGFVPTVILLDFLLNKEGTNISPITYVVIAANILFYVGMRIYFFDHDPIYRVENEFAPRIFYVVNVLLAFGQLFNNMALFLRTAYGLEKRLHDAALLDPLTGLYNRRGLRIFMEQNVDRMNLSERTSAMSVLDVDYFKHFNDTYGHDAGDLVLRNLAGVLKTRMEQEEGFLAARVGGEEFVMLYHSENREKIHDFFVRLQDEFGQSPVKVSGYTLHYTVTMGVVYYTGDAEEDQKRADQLLYKGKESGRNRVVFEDD